MGDDDQSFDDALHEVQEASRRAHEAERRLRETIEDGRRTAEREKARNAERRKVAEALARIADRDDLEALLELIEEHPDDVEHVEKTVALFGDDFARFFGRGIEAGKTGEERAREVADWIFGELEKASRSEDPVLTTAELADAVRPLSEAVFEEAMIHLEFLATMRRFATFARRAREVAPIASRLASALGEYASHAETFDQLIEGLEQQRGIAETFEGLLALLGKTEILSLRAEEAQSAIANEIASVFREARQAGLLSEPARGETAGPP